MQIAPNAITFFKDYVSTFANTMSNHSGHTCDCASSSTWMTELFDGDISLVQSQNARAHLKSCGHCQRVWREWSSTRAALREVALPTTPPTLQERVLLSCRLLPSQDAVAQSALENEIACEELARYINAPEAEYSAVFAAPLNNFFATAPVPADLKSQILKLTTQAETQRAKTPIAVSISRTVSQSIFTMPVWQNLSASASVAARDWSLPRAGRWGFALAVPALAAWVLMVSPPSNIAPLAVSPATAPSTLQSATQSSSANSSFSASFFQNLLPDIATRMAASPIVPKPKTMVAIKPAEAKTPAEEVAADKSPETVIEERPLASTIAASAPSQSGFRLTSFPTSAPTAKPTIAKPTVVLPKSGLKKPPTRTASIGSPKKINPRKTPMLDMTRSRRVSQPSVSFSDNARLIAASMLKRLPSNDERSVTNIQNVEERDTEPSRFAGTFGEAMESVGRLRDDRPEELGKAFDDYRASLLEANDAEELSEEELDEQL